MSLKYDWIDIEDIRVGYCTLKHHRVNLASHYRRGDYQRRGTRESRYWRYCIRRTRYVRLLHSHGGWASRRRRRQKARVATQSSVLTVVYRFIDFNFPTRAIPLSLPLISLVFPLSSEKHTARAFRKPIDRAQPGSLASERKT